MCDLYIIMLSTKDERRPHLPVQSLFTLLEGTSNVTPVIFMAGTDLHDSFKIYN